MKVKQKPIPPAPNECCESGCDPCIWDIYRNKLRKWEQAQVQQAQVAADANPSANTPSAAD